MITSIAKFYMFVVFNLYLLSSDSPQSGLLEGGSLFSKRTGEGSLSYYVTLKFIHFEHLPSVGNTHARYKTCERGYVVILRYFHSF